MESGDKTMWNSDGNGHTFCGHGHFWHALFQIFRARATRALPIPEISGHGQGFPPMPYGMPSIFGNFAGMGKQAFALFVNLQARALWALDFWPTGGQKWARACPFPSLASALLIFAQLCSALLLTQSSMPSYSSLKP